MTLSDNRGWDALAAVITPALLAALRPLQPFRKTVRDDVDYDSYYQPPEPVWETERVIFCLTCDGETVHTILKFRFEGATAECQECEALSDFEGDE